MSDAPAPPPRRTVLPYRAPDEPTIAPTWKDKMKAKGSVWGKVAMEKGILISDNVGGRVNGLAEKMGSEAFWPTTGDFPKEMDKAARILRAFTVDGIEVEPEEKEKDEAKKKGKKPVRVLRKIPPQVIAEAKGLAIFTSMRTAIAPFGGAGGAGIVIAKLPDGTWSAPSSMSPNNLSTGFMIGADVYDAVLIIRTQKALDSFATHKATLGTDIAVVAGPYGAGAAYEAGLEKAPVLSYVRSRGIYAGVQLVGQIFVERFDENAAMYHWKGVKAGDILAGKVKVPLEAKALIQALQDAETGVAQREKGDQLDVVVPEGIDDVDLHEGEVLKLPPTPTQSAEQEAAHPIRMVPPPYEGERVSGTSTPVGEAKPRFMPPLPSRRETPPVPTAAALTTPYRDSMTDAEVREWDQHEEQLRHDAQQQSESDVLAQSLVPNHTASLAPQQTESPVLVKDQMKADEELAKRLSALDSRQ